MTILVKFVREERGFCRKYYVPVDKKDKRLFCIQEDFPSQFHWYICSKDGEPCRVVNYEFEVVELHDINRA